MFYNYKDRYVANRVEKKGKKEIKKCGSDYV